MPISINISAKDWLDEKPASIKGKDVEKALTGLQKVEKEYNAKPSARSGAALKFSLLDALKALKDARREVDRKDKEANGVLGGYEDTLGSALASLEGELASAEAGGTGEDDESEDDTKLADPGLVKKLVNKLSAGPMNFAFGFNETGRPVLMMSPPKKKAGKALAALMKSDCKVGKPTFGVASDQGGSLQFQVDGNKVGGMAKGVKGYFKDNGITAYTSFLVAAADGNESAESEEEENKGGAQKTAGSGKTDLKGLLKLELQRLPKPFLATLNQGILSGLLQDVQDQAPANAGESELKALLRKHLEKLPGAGANGPIGPQGGPGAGGPKNDEPPPFKPGVVVEEDPKPDATRPFEIGGSVGAKGKNKQEDVLAVQAQLNKVAKSGLQVDGKCGPKTIAAIFKYQKGCGIPADGRIDPGGMTERMLKGKSGGVVGPGPDQANYMGEGTQIGPNPSGNLNIPKIPPVGPNGPQNPQPNTPDVPPVAPPPPKPGPNPGPKPAPELPPVNGPLALKKPVGKGGSNQKDDVVAAQSALNRNGASLKIDGLCGPKTIAAITAYQKQIGFKRPDGLIEPGKYTENWLNGNQVPLPLDKPKGGGGTPPKAPPSPGPGKGNDPKPDPAADPHEWLRHEEQRTSYANAAHDMCNRNIEGCEPLPKRAKDARIAHPMNYLKNKGAVDRLIEDAEARFAQAQQYLNAMRTAGAKFMKSGDMGLLAKIQEEEQAIYDATRRCTDSANAALKLLEA